MRCHRRTRGSIGLSRSQELAEKSRQITRLKRARREPRKKRLEIGGIPAHRFGSQSRTLINDKAGSLRGDASMDVGKELRNLAGHLLD